MRAKDSSIPASINQKNMKIDHISLHAEEFTTEYPIESAIIWHEDGRFAINIEGEENEDFDVDYADENDPFYFVGPPIVNFHWASDSSALSALEETTVKIDESYDETLGAHVSTLYLSAHYDLNNVVVTFQEASPSKIIATIMGSTSAHETDVPIKVLAHVSLELTKG